jgi:hypothetical protein
MHLSDPSWFDRKEKVAKHFTGAMEMSNSNWDVGFGKSYKRHAWMPGALG